MTPPPRVAIVIPTLNEASALPLLLGDLGRLDVPHEIVVADGGSTDGTPRVALAAGARVIDAPKGRGAQLAAGARATSAGLLGFLHADVRLSRRAIDEVERIATETVDAAWAFRLHIDAKGAGYRLVETGANIRSRLLRLPYGDQGLFVTRTLYERAGGFLPLPLMEDVTLVRALGRLGPVHLLDAAVTASPRRWRRAGLLGGTVRNWSLLAAWMLGVAPARLARWYRPERQPPPPR